MSDCPGISLLDGTGRFGSGIREGTVTDENEEAFSRSAAKPPARKCEKVVCVKWSGNCKLVIEVEEKGMGECKGLEIKCVDRRRDLLREHPAP